MEQIVDIIGVKKQMKKAFATIIALSSVGLVLGGLIFLGISAFPELLQNEEDIQEKEARTNTRVNHSGYGGQDNAAGEPGEGGYVIGYGSGTGTNNNASGDFEIITIPAHGGFKDSAGTSSSNHGTGIPDYDNHFFEISLPEKDNSIDSVYIPPISTQEHFSFTSFEEIVESSLKADSFEVKKNQTSFIKAVSSNQAVVATSLVVIGVVDIISVLLVEHKRRVFAK